MKVQSSLLCSSFASAIILAKKLLHSVKTLVGVLGASIAKVLQFAHDDSVLETPDGLATWRRFVNAK